MDSLESLPGHGEVYAKCRLRFNSHSENLPRMSASYCAHSGRFLLVYVRFRGLLDGGADLNRCGRFDGVGPAVFEGDKPSQGGFQGFEQIGRGRHQHGVFHVERVVALFPRAVERLPVEAARALSLALFVGKAAAPPRWRSGSAATVGTCSSGLPSKRPVRRHQLANPTSERRYSFEFAGVSAFVLRCSPSQRARAKTAPSYPSYQYPVSNYPAYNYYPTYNPVYPYPSIGVSTSPYYGWPR